MNPLELAFSSIPASLINSTLSIARRQCSHAAGIPSSNSPTEPLHVSTYTYSEEDEQANQQARHRCSGHWPDAISDVPGYLFSARPFVVGE